MKITEARIEMSDGREAVYVGEAADMPKLPEWPMIAISVKDFEEAQEIIATLDRSRARKRASEKDEDPTAKEPGPGPLPPKCIAPECANAALLDTDLCTLHSDVPESIAAEWRRKVTPKPEAKRRARGIREGVEGETGKVA